MNPSEIEPFAGDLPANLGLELARATEAAAVAAGVWSGLGDPAGADESAACHMLEALQSISISGQVVLREELLAAGQDSPCSGLAGLPELGAGGARVDLALDPIDGRTQLAKGYPGAISAAAAAPKGSMWAPFGANYMSKIIVSQETAAYLTPECLDSPAPWTLALLARIKGVPISALRVFLLDRPRHADLLNEIRAAGAHVILRQDGDIVGALMVCTPRSGVDILMGTGGLPEGLMAACAVKALGGAMLGRLDPQSAGERQALREAGHDERQIRTVDQIIAGRQVFFAATGITDSAVLRGVVYTGKHIETNSMILRGETGTRRLIFSEHRADR